MGVVLLGIEGAMEGRGEGVGVWICVAWSSGGSSCVCVSFGFLEEGEGRTRAGDSGGICISRVECCRRRRGWIWAGGPRMKGRGPGRRRTFRSHHLEVRRALGCGSQDLELTSWLVDAVAGGEKRLWS
jgi:hypothetical protein